MPVQTNDFLAPFRFPGVLNSQELLVAEAVHARAWHALQSAGEFNVEHSAAARDRLARIVVRLMIGARASSSELASAAIALFRNESLINPVDAPEL